MLFGTSALRVMYATLYIQTFIDIRPIPLSLAPTMLTYIYAYLLGTPTGNHHHMLLTHAKSAIQAIDDMETLVPTRCERRVEVR